MNNDIVDQLLTQWGQERPGLDASSLGVVVRIQLLAKLLQKRTTRALAAHDLKHWEYDVLSVLRRQGDPFELPATEIAAAAMLTSGAMTTRIDGLEDRNLVRRRANRADRRSVLVRLTPGGKRLVDAAITARLEDANDVLSGIELRARVELADTLRELLMSVAGHPANR